MSSGNPKYEHVRYMYNIFYATDDRQQWEKTCIYSSNLYPVFPVLTLTEILKPIWVLYSPIHRKCLKKTTQILRRKGNTKTTNTIAMELFNSFLRDL